MPHTVFLKEVAAEARKGLNLKKGQPIHAIQDGFKAQWTQECLDVMADENIEARHNSTRSPGLNPVENLFGMSGGSRISKMHRTRQKA